MWKTQDATQQAPRHPKTANASQNGFSAYQGTNTASWVTADRAKSMDTGQKTRLLLQKSQTGNVPFKIGLQAFSGNQKIRVHKARRCCHRPRRSARWLDQAARKTVGSKGFVLALDLKPIEPFTQQYVRTIICDMTEDDAIQQIRELLPRKADVVISDASPSISGIWEVDHARQVDLAQKALCIASETLKPEGNFLSKSSKGTCSTILWKK